MLFLKLKEGASVPEKETCQCFGIALVAVITHWFGWIY